MKIAMTLIWGFILIHMLNYVGSSMMGVPYNFTTATTLAIGAFILIYLAGLASNVTVETSEE